MHGRALAWLVGALALWIVTVGFTLRVFADEPPKPAPKPLQDPAAPYDAARTASERAANVAAYARNISGSRAYLLHEHLGEWVAIAGGKAFPVNVHGTAVAPAARMEAAVAAARASVPNARHRFVFRIGEEGDIEQPLGGVERPHVFGVWFMAALEPHVEALVFGANLPLRYAKGSVRKVITVKGPDSRTFVRPEIGPPGQKGRAEALYCLSTGFGGYGVMSNESAIAASLHLWEVPGEISIEGAFQNGACRRARVRIVFPGTDIDLLLPVAVWPERP